MKLTSELRSSTAEERATVRRQLQGTLKYMPKLNETMFFGWGMVRGAVKRVGKDIYHAKVWITGEPRDALLDRRITGWEHALNDMDAVIR